MKSKREETIEIKGIPETPLDPWMHRSAGMVCKTCMWYVPKTSAVGTKEVGRCRRHAPTMSGYPVVYFNDWCGDHRIDENKV